VLPLAFTIATLRAQKLLGAWPPGGGRQVERCFYFTQRWLQDREKLLGSQNRQIRWWDEADTGTPTHEVHENSASFLDPSVDPSPRGRLDVMVERFVCGVPRNHLIRPFGAAMEPPFKRMEKRDGIDLSPVVRMRTHHTRTFGFYAGPRIYVAHRVALADDTHADRSLNRKYGQDVLALLRRVSSSDVDLTSDVEYLIGD
jgi:hypothetical protein